MIKQDKVGLIRSYLDIFINDNIKTGELLYDGNKIVTIDYTNKGQSIFLKTSNSITKRINIIDIIGDSKLNFNSLFIKNYKYFYEKKDIGYNGMIEKLLIEIEKIR